jgi:hypothetical protein
MIKAMQLNVELLILIRQPSRSSAQLLLTVLKQQQLNGNRENRQPVEPKSIKQHKATKIKLKKNCGGQLS